MRKRRATAIQKEKRIEVVITLLAMGKGYASIVEHLMKTEEFSLRQAQRYYAQGKKRLSEYGEQSTTERLGIVRKRNDMLQQQALAQKDLKALHRSIQNDIQLHRFTQQHPQPKRGQTPYVAAPFEAMAPSCELEELLAAFRTEGDSAHEQTNE